jgi:DNA modification methylase
MEVVNINISDLVQAEYNPRKLSDAQEQKLMDSMKRLGVLEPAVINIHPERQNIIISGHQRLKVARKLGMREYPCVEVEFTLAQEKEANIRMNQNGGDWDKSILDEFFDNKDLLDFGFDETSLADLMGESEIDDMNVSGDIDEAKQDDVPEVPKEAKTQLGDIYKLGEHRLMCGDSTSLLEVEALMEGQEVGMVFTDPPYNVAFNGRSGKHDVIKNDNLSVDDFSEFISSFCDVLNSLKVETYYVWCNWRFYGLLQERIQYKACIVWAKNVFGLGRGYRHQHEFCLFNGKLDEGINNESDLWNIKRDSKYVHPTQKPVALAERALGNHKNAVTILDLFGGSGSTLIACEKLGRKCRMMEIDPKYCDVIVKRWEDLTGKKAELLTG